MGILKYKYKAHKFVNYAFYVVVFIVGFLLGFSTEKIDFNKLISQVLMIGNVSAAEKYYSINSSSFSRPSSSNFYNEEFIFNTFTKINEITGLNLDFKEYNNVLVRSKTKGVWTASNNYTFFFSNGDYSGSASGSLYANGTSVIYLSLDYYSSTFSLAHYTNLTPSYNLSSGSSTYISATNTSLSTTYKLDFSEYTLKLEFNENLFKNNSNFKQVCVNTDTRFAITSNNITSNDDETGLKYFNGIDFIWFSYVPDGLSTYLYSSAEDTKVTELTEDGPLFSGINPGKWYYLDEKEEIDKFFNIDPSKGEIYPGVQLELEGYTDKYSHFGWYFHPFVVHFDNTTDGNNFFNVFHFKEDINFYSTLENGLDYYEELENARNGNVCFYIKNDYDIIILNKDIFDDDIGETTILGGDKLDIGTSVNSSSLNSKGLFSKINLFIKNIKVNITFVNEYIYELYISMPYIVQLFILTILGLIVVKILVGMVTR